MSSTATTTATADNATNPESKKHDDTKKMWSTNYRETENPAIRQKWIDNSYGSNAQKEQSSTTTTVTNPSLGASMQIVTIFLFVWVFLGLIAFVWSLYCFRKSGSTEQKVLGFLLAVFLGPLFFIYFRFSKNYCK